MPPNIAHLSIGDLASATGITVYALRQWERRYGSPVAEKRSSGHRRYSTNEVKRLRLVAELLQHGHRASKVVPLPYESLVQLFEEKEIRSLILLNEQWLEHIKAWSEEALRSSLEKSWQEFTPLEFVTDLIAPFLKRLGDSWQYGEVSIAQEHFFSEILESFLTEKWRHRNQQNLGSQYILASTEGETHSMGLLMCAVTLAHEGVNVLYLGASTPCADIIEAAKNDSTKAVCLSYSVNYKVQLAEEQILKMKESLSGSQIYLGGDGAPQIQGVQSFKNFKDFCGSLKEEK